jgi:hypothetical protein
MPTQVASEVTPDVLKKLEKDIAKEAKTDEKKLKYAVQELHSTEKAEADMKKVRHSVVTS